MGRAFLQASFPTQITTWSPPGHFLDVRASNFATPFMQAPVDAVTTATPLNLMKFASESTPVMDLLRGNIAGSLGETSAIIIIVCGIVLAARRTFDWRIPVSIVVATVVLSGALYAVKGKRAPMKPGLGPSIF